MHCNARQAINLDEDHMDTRKEIFRGLVGLGGIEEHDDEDFPLPDLDGLQDEDLMAWSEVETGRNIPQFDGGGDDSHSDERKRKAPAEEWKKAVHATGRRKGRVPPPSLRAPKGKATESRKNCEIVATGSSSDSVARSHSSVQSPCHPKVPALRDTQPSDLHSSKHVSLVEDSSMDDCMEEDSSIWDTSMEVDLTDQPGKQPELNAILQRGPTLIPALKTEYPIPASPEREYFLSDMHKMWSSPEQSPERPAFIYSPPRPGTPSIVPAPGTAQTTHPASLDGSHILKESSFSSAGLSNPEMAQSSRLHQSNGQMMHQTFMKEAYQTQDEALDTLQTDDDEHGDTSECVMVEDTVIYEQFDLTSSQQESPKACSAEKPIMPRSNMQVYQFSVAPPTTQELLSSFSDHGLPNVVHQKPHFSVESDVPSKAKVFGGKEFRLQSKGIKAMQPFNSDLGIDKRIIQGEGFRFWVPNQTPPSRSEIQEWLKQEAERARPTRPSTEPSTQKRREQISQIEGPTQKNPFGCKNTPTKIAASVAVEKDFMDVLSLEVHCQTREGLLPNPKMDPILAVFYCWQAERDDLVSNGWVPGYVTYIYGGSCTLLLKC
jgi:hypothetical protein